MPDRPRPDHTRGGHEDKKPPQQHSVFAELNLRPELLRGISKLGWSTPSQIQQEVIPLVTAGHDVLGIAQTGTGKTGAFALPLLQMLADRPPAAPLKPYAVILAPTRELVQQIEQQFIELGREMKIRTVAIFGGVSDRPQVSALNAGVEVVVAAPGRLLDLMGQGWVDFTQVAFCVLDEADRMLDMGFIRDIRRILNRMPSRKQMLLLSATLPNEIKELVHEFLYQPREVHIGVSGPPKELSHKILEVMADDKLDALQQVIRGPYESILIFTRTKHGADKLSRKLAREAGESLAVLHADRSQAQRDTALARFRSGHARTLVATDVASRGIDVVGIELVVNYDVPRDPEDYVHRVGRTARAKRPGLAVTLCTPEEIKYLRKVEQLIGHRIERMETSYSITPPAGGGSDRAPQRERASDAAPRSPRAERAPRGEGRGRPERSERPAPIVPALPGAEVPVEPRGRRRREEQQQHPVPRRAERAVPESSYVEEWEITPTWETSHLRSVPDNYDPEEARSGGDRSGRGASAGRGPASAPPSQRPPARRAGGHPDGIRPGREAPTKPPRGPREGFEARPPREGSDARPPRQAGGSRPPAASQRAEGAAAPPLGDDGQPRRRRRGGRGRGGRGPAGPPEASA